MKYLYRDYIKAKVYTIWVRGPLGKVFLKSLYEACWAQSYHERCHGCFTNGKAMVTAISIGTIVHVEICFADSGLACFASARAYLGC